ncbi:MAD2L1-binding protein-like, partial [Clarias magur]
LEEGAVRKSIQSSGDLSWQRCERTLRDLDKVLDHLEEHASFSHVSHMLYMLGSSRLAALQPPGAGDPVPFENVQEFK